jgi:hypothetical protein
MRKQLTADAEQKRRARMIAKAQQPLGVLFIQNTVTPGLTYRLGTGRITSQQTNE